MPFIIENAIADGNGRRVRSFLARNTVRLNGLPQRVGVSALAPGEGQRAGPAAVRC